MPTVGAYEAKTRLPELLGRVSRGERFTITKHGRPVAELTPPARSTVESVIEEAMAFRASLGDEPSRVRELVADRRRM